MEQQTFLDMPSHGEYLLPEGEPVMQCRSCGASIVWSRTRVGNPVPLDVSPVRIINGLRYVKTHFTSCPQGREWRKKA